MTQQEEDRLSNQQTSVTTGYSNVMIDSIVHGKMQEFINKMRPFYHSPCEEKSGNEKNCSPNISTATSANAVTMESIEQMLHNCFQDNNSKSNSRNNNKAPLIKQVYDMNGIPITYCWYHGIKSNLRHNIKYCKRHKEGHKSNATYQN